MFLISGAKESNSLIIHSQAEIFLPGTSYLTLLANTFSEADDLRKYKFCKPEQNAKGK